MRRLLVHLTVLVLLAPGCSGGTDGGVVVRMDEYELEPQPASAEAGTVHFTARNEGAIAHQLLILETRLAADKLPVKSGVVRTDAKGIDVLAEGLAAPDATADVEAELDPGTYVLICNIAGHYPNGMHARFRVTKPPA